MSAFTQRLVRQLINRDVKIPTRARAQGPTVIVKEPRCFLCAHRRSEHAIDEKRDHKFCRACNREGAMLEETLENGVLDRLDCNHPFFPDEEFAS